MYKRSLLVNNEKKQVKEQVKEATTYQELQQKEADITTHGCVALPILSASHTHNVGCILNAYFCCMISVP